MESTPEYVASSVDLIAHPIHVIFRMGPEELQWLASHGKHRNFHSSQRKLLAYGILCVVMLLAVLVFLALQVRSHVATAKLAGFLPAIGIASYRGYTLLRTWWQCRTRYAALGQDSPEIVFHATREGFSLIVPGVRETSVNWTAVEQIRMEPPLLSFVAYGRVYYLPSRAISSDDFNRLNLFLQELS